MIIKPEGHVQNPAEILCQYNMKLNPKKRSFIVRFRKFFGYDVSVKGNEASPDKIQAIQDMQVLKTVKQVQNFIGIVAALSRFVSKATGQCLPFFNLIKKGKSLLETMNALRHLRSWSNI